MDFSRIKSFDLEAAVQTLTTSANSGVWRLRQQMDELERRAPGRAEATPSPEAGQRSYEQAKQGDNARYDKLETAVMAMTDLLHKVRLELGQPRRIQVRVTKDGNVHIPSGGNYSMFD
ncbi:hypothetical protein ACFL2Q_19245 [Thermodesulfobacteriota bacterium]